MMYRWTTLNYNSEYEKHHDIQTGICQIVSHDAVYWYSHAYSVNSRHIRVHHDFLTEYYWESKLKIALWEWECCYHVLLDQL